MRGERSQQQMRVSCVFRAKIQRSRQHAQDMSHGSAARTIELWLLFHRIDMLPRMGGHLQGLHVNHVLRRAGCPGPERARVFRAKMQWIATTITTMHESLSSMLSLGNIQSCIQGSLNEH